MGFNCSGNESQNEAELAFEHRWIKCGLRGVEGVNSTHVTNVRQVQIISPSSRFPAVMEMQIPATLLDKWDLYLTSHRLPLPCIANGGAQRTQMVLGLSTRPEELWRSCKLLKRIASAPQRITSSSAYLNSHFQEGTPDSCFSTTLFTACPTAWWPFPMVPLYTCHPWRTSLSPLCDITRWFV